jgi:hypothetical protein
LGMRYVDELICRDDATPQRVYVTQDANFNLTSIANTGGSVLERYLIDPYGNRTIMNASWTIASSSAYNWVIGHQGLLHDPESRLIYNRMRFRHCTLGCFTGRDPLQTRSEAAFSTTWHAPVSVPVLMTVGLAESLPSFVRRGRIVSPTISVLPTNLYEFPFSRPTSVVDPNGEQGWEEVAVGGIAIGSLEYAADVLGLSLLSCVLTPACLKLAVNASSQSLHKSVRHEEKERLGYLLLLRNTE